MAIKLLWWMIVMMLGTLVSSEAPYSASPAGESVSANTASEAATLLKDSTKESAKEDALEEAALTEAAMQDDGIGEKVEDTKENAVLPAAAKVMVPKNAAPVKPHLRGPKNAVAAARALVNASQELDDAGGDTNPVPLFTATLATGAPEAANTSAPEAAEAGHVSASTAGMEKAITDLMLGKSTFGATPFGKSVSQITDLIEHDMMPKVMAAHTANQRELDRLNDATRECGKTKDIGIGKANKKKVVYMKMSPLHKTCRSGEAGKHTEKTECLSELKDKRGLMKLKCAEFAFKDKKYGDQNANRQIVKKAAGEHTEVYLRRITHTVCGTYPPGGKGGGGLNGHLDVFLKAKEACEKATVSWKHQFKKCDRIIKEYRGKRQTCDNLQDQMDDASCKRAIDMKDACETYAECYYDKRKVYVDTEKMVKVEEKDRQAEWRGLKRMQCLMQSFSDGKVSASEVDACKKKTIDVGHLVIKYPKVPKLVACSVPNRYPTTAQYKLAEFAPLPAMAKGRADANECTGVIEISVKPFAKSPKSCKCERMTLNGPYSAGPLVKCSNCKDVRRSEDQSSCPWGTKIFSPRSRSDWRTIFASVGPLRNPHFILDVTRPQNGCGGCTRKAMNSGPGGQGSYWHTADGSPWWLRSKAFKEPNGNYQKNCYLALFNKAKQPWDVNNLKFDDDGCKFHAKSYYCQLKHYSTRPKRGSPVSCKCEKLALTGVYSAGALIECNGCLRVSKSTQKNSCPVGSKLFSPANRRDWKTVLASAKPLRSPNWIIDVTRPQNGCGGCQKNPMHSGNAAQGTWRTSDASPWWLRSTRYSEPNGDYYANCYLDIWKTPANENSVMFNDGRCNYHSNAYYCQPVRKRLK